MKINIIGAGLAGSEAALLLAELGQEVNLYEMKPNQKSEAHHMDEAGELVCSNSFRSASLENAVGLLKEELRLLDSPIMKIANECQTPAGSAMAVDRELFAKAIEKSLHENPLVKYYKNQTIQSLDENEIYLVCTGPLTDKLLHEFLQAKLGTKSLHFFDAAAPIISEESLDFSKVYFKSRYNKGEASYLNCPMTKEEYLLFYNELIKAELAEVKDFDREIVFEGCMPIEVMAKRGEDTMRFGPLKPIGLENPETGEQAYAVVQLRQDDKARTMYNIVGFQTRLKFAEQKRVFSLIPGLENAKFLRYGVMHRNIYLQSPELLNSSYQSRQFPNWFFAGQMTGVEGYVESIASGHMAARNILLYKKGLSERFDPTDATVMGSMAHYISDAKVKRFQPMNANFGLIRAFESKVKKHEKSKIIERSRELILQEKEKMRQLLCA